MSGKQFELGDYVEVKDRIAIFYELYANGRLVTDDVQMLTAPDGTQRVMVKALAYRTPDDPHPGVGHSWLSIPGKTPYTAGSEVENAETSAWGRAIGSLGILIDKSIATRNEIDSKASDGGAAGTRSSVSEPDGLIGDIAVQGSQDFELRQTPDGTTLPFRVKSGRQSQIVAAHDAIALALRAIGKVGDRVQVWGSFTTESFVKDGREISFQVLHVDRLVGPDYSLPAPEEAETVAAFSEAELAEVGV